MERPNGAGNQKPRDGGVGIGAAHGNADYGWATEHPTPCGLRGSCCTRPRSITVLCPCSEPNENNERHLRNAGPLGVI